MGKETQMMLASRGWDNDSNMKQGENIQKLSITVYKQEVLWSIAPVQPKASICKMLLEHRHIL